MGEGVLYVVATPIGNMDDMTPRAVSVLGEVDLIAAEDTRHTKKLLSHFGIKTPVTSYFEHNEIQKAEELLRKLKDGKSIALVTDAGTPGISDPGFRLVTLASEGGIKVSPIPGASALAAALSVSGLPTDSFTFKGFLPASSEKRRNALRPLKDIETTYIFYESARRIVETLEDMLETLGNVDAVICRELTKVYEEVIRGSVGELLKGLRDRELKGEVTLIVRTAAPPEAGEIDVKASLERFFKAGLSLKDAVKAATDETGAKKGDVYKIALTMKGDG
ncbi:MAG: 16S rRNA (cytidine(1402)-2'-O)-methyltransferase [Deltaproteobacteria bacterium]|nr:16S rRNA (cytidine(1402)-2'-O)-methyltransferase [Deltaproteobacteria bacterium]